MLAYRFGDECHVKNWIPQTSSKVRLTMLQKTVDFDSILMTEVTPKLVVRACNTGNFTAYLSFLDSHVVIS